MSDTSANDVKFSLKVMVSRKERKVLFAEADSTFADVLLSFLTLPLGSIVKVLKKHCGDDGPNFGSLTTLYDGLANLDSSHFHAEGAKSILLHPRSSSDALRKGLKLDISDSPPLEYFVPSHSCSYSVRFDSISMYQDNPHNCKCYNTPTKMKKEVAKTNAPTVPCPGGVFTETTASFLITDDLQIVVDIGLFQTVSVLGIIDMDDVETKNIELGFSDVMDLLNASLISSTQLSDIILYKAGEKRKCAERILSYHQTEKALSFDSKKKTMSVKLILQKSTNKLLYAEVEEDFVEFLFGFLYIPLGEVERLLGNNSLMKSIDNLYKSATDLIQKKYFISRNMLIQPMIPHGYISRNHIFPHTEECLPCSYNRCSWSTSIKFPEGQGNYLIGPRSFKVTDDLTVTPFCTTSILSSLKEKKIRVSDVEELPLQIGMEEGLSILKASLTSTTALTDALLTQLSKKQVKREVH